MRWTVAVLGVALACGGCASMGENVNGDGRFTLHDEGYAANGPVLRLDRTDRRWNERFERAYAEERTDPRNVDRGLRRELVLALISESNAKCDNYLVGLTGVQNSYDVGLTLTGLALTTAGGLASPQRSANLLASLATFFGATNRELTDNVFGGHDIEVLVNAITSGRDVEQRALKARLESAEFDRWDATSILDEIHAYDQNCGISYGLRRLQESVNIAAQAQNRDTARRSEPSVALNPDGRQETGGSTKAAGPPVAPVVSLAPP